MTPFFFSLLSFILFFFTFSLLYYNKKFPCYSYKTTVFPIMMMSFCRKIAPHSTAATTSTAASTSLDAHHEKLPFKCHHCISPLSCTASGGGLLGSVNAPDYHHIKQPLLLESSSIKSSSSCSSSCDSSLSPLFSPPPPRAIQFETKKDYTAGFGFIDYIGGGVDGLMSCTESLGFESSDERRVDDHQIIETIGHRHRKEDEDPVEEDACLRMMRQSMRTVSKWKRTGEKRAEAKKFPPPLSSLNQNGHPSYYLRPVRKDGRLELTEVRIYRPEILRACRQDGRLRLHLVTYETDLQEEEEQQLLQGMQEEEEVIDEEESIINVKEDEKQEEERKMAVGGEGFWRCQNLLSGGHHHHRGNLAVWSQRQRCVTTR